MEFRPLLLSVRSDAKPCIIRSRRARANTRETLDCPAGQVPRNTEGCSLSAMPNEAVKLIRADVARGVRLRAEPLRP